MPACSKVFKICTYHPSCDGGLRHHRGEDQRRPHDDLSLRVNFAEGAWRSTQWTDVRYHLAPALGVADHLGLKTVETRSWPAPARLVGQRIAIHAGKRLVRQPGERIERELRARWGEHWPVNMPTGAVVATAVLAGMAQVARADLLEGCAVHDPWAEIGCAAGMRRTPIDPWGDFSSGRWLWFLDDVEALPEPVPAVGRQSLWRWDAGDQRW